ncbi:TlpA family protein disulfide reductase [Belliella marina]|uniref:TlpA family protein disulfide reductase n=1 Tax=Belliella marina TaxID=1644146 RepID=A0ABW4VS20_9BACT
MKKIFTIIISIIAGNMVVAQSIQGLAFEDAISDGQNRENSALIYFKYTKYSDRDADTLKVELWDHYFGKLAKTHGYTFKNIPLRKGSMLEGLFPSSDQVITVQIADLHKPSYISLSLSSNNTMEKFLIFPGDSIKIYSQPFRNILTFSGPSAPLFECQRALRNQRLADAFLRPAKYIHPNQASRNTFLDKKDNSAKYDQAKLNFGEVLDLSVVDNTYLERLKSNTQTVPTGGVYRILEFYRDQISQEAFDLLLADEIGFLYNRLIKDWSSAYSFKKIEGDTEFLQKLKAFYYEEIHPLNFGFDIETIKNSTYFKDFLISKSKAESNIKDQPIFKTLGQYPDDIRDFLIGKYLFNNFGQLSNGTEILNDVLTYVREPYIRQKLEELYSKKGSGQAVKDFEFKDIDGNLVRLSDFKGKTVLLDFWFTGCKACINFYETYLSQVENHFEETDGFVLVSISTDKDPSKWKNSVAGGRYSSPTGVNLYTNGEGFNHSFLIDYNITGAPYQLLIDKDGRMIQSGGLQVSHEKLIPLLEAQIGSINQ